MTKRSNRNRRDPELTFKLTMVGMVVLGLVLLTFGTHFLITTMQKGRGIRRVVTRG